MGSNVKAGHWAPDVAEARGEAALKRMLGLPLTDKDWTALERGPFHGDIHIKRPEGWKPES